MRSLFLAVTSLLLAGCSYRLPLYTPEVLVHPPVIHHGGSFRVDLWGASIGQYRFMGARRQADGSWDVRIDPMYLGIVGEQSVITVRDGELLPLGPSPTVLVKVVSVRATELRLIAVSPLTPHVSD